MNDAENLTKWVAIARTGTFRDSSGREHRFTEQDLDAIRTGYDPARSEAALVFGHPKDSDPAFGWVHDLKQENGILSARFASVPDKVKKLVDDGRYRYVSMSLSPDKRRLLHVGLLGAAAPAIDGLGPVRFKETDQGITINFTTTRPEGAAVAALSDKAGKDGSADFASVPPQERRQGDPMTLEELQKRIGVLEEQLKARESEIAGLKTKLAEAESGRGQAEKKARETAAEFAAFKDGQVRAGREARVDALVKAGKLEPAKRGDTLSFAAALGALTNPVNFTAPDGKVEEISPEEAFFRDLESRQPDPRFVNFSAQAPYPGHAMTPAADWSPEDMTSKM